MDHAIVIGVEHYQDKSIPQVVYAERDATEIAKVLGDLKFTSEVLLSAKATKTTIESIVRRVAKAATADEALYLFYAGHGFSQKDKNFITCHDTQRGDLARTSVQLQGVFDALRKSASKRVAIFLDACESGMLADLSVRGIFTSFNDQELEEFFAKSEFYVCFSACKSDESSYPDGSVKHGIWTYHLLQALRGDAHLSMEKGLVTVTSLQNYLAREVPLRVRTVRKKLEQQTPWACGAMSSEFVVADVRELLRQREQAKLAAAKEMTQATLRGERSQDVTRLSGFKKRFHHVPDSASAAANNFVASIADADLQAHLDAIHAALRQELGYKRRDLVDKKSGGGGTIQTPDFEYAINISVDPEDPSMVIWRHEVSRITTQDVIKSKGFENALGKYLDTIEYEFTTTFEVEEFIDRVEDDEPDGVDIHYERGSSECEVHIEGFDGFLRLTPGSIIVTGLKRPTPKALVESLFSASKLLVAKKGVLALPF